MLIIYVDTFVAEFSWICHVIILSTNELYFKMFSFLVIFLLFIAKYLYEGQSYIKWCFEAPNCVTVFIIIYFSTIRFHNVTCKLFLFGSFAKIWEVTVGINSLWRLFYVSGVMRLPGTKLISSYVADDSRYIEWGDVTSTGSLCVSVCPPKWNLTFTTG